jgi:hypothetical protein
MLEKVRSHNEKTPEENTPLALEVLPHLPVRRRFKVRS